MGNTKQSPSKEIKKKTHVRAYKKPTEKETKKEIKKKTPVKKQRAQEEKKEIKKRAPPKNQTKKTNNNDDEGEYRKKPGQRYQEPSFDDPSRAFYETLYEHNPESEMAQRYCLNYGLLPEEKAQELFLKFNKKK